MQETFADLCVNEAFHQHGYQGEEHDEAQFSHLTRLAFTFTGRNQGRLRELVDYINSPENWSKPSGEQQSAHQREPLNA